MELWRKSSGIAKKCTTVMSLESISTTKGVYLNFLG